MHWFGWYKGDPCKLDKNGIARSMVDLLVPMCESIQKEMEKANEESIVPSQAYLEYQYNWFGKKYGSETDTTFVNKEMAKDELIAFLESYADGRKLLYSKGKNSETAKFSEEFTKLYDNAFERENKNLGTPYRLSKTKELFEKQQLNYKLESGRETTGKKSTFWKVVRNAEV